MYLILWMLFVWALNFIGVCFGILPAEIGGEIDFLDEFIPPRHNDKFSNPAYPFTRGHGNNVGTDYADPDERFPDSKHRCSERLENALEKIRKRQISKQKTLDLNGYSLHHQLRTVPYDMYVTEMRVRVPATSTWVRVDLCKFDPRNSTLETRLLFNDLTISGKVNLFSDGELQREPPTPNPDDTCSMILRLRRAGIGYGI